MRKSIRFYNDYEVRAVWDEENSKWWFSATDIVRAINDDEDYKKAGNYWRWLKKKLTTDGIQLVSVTHEFKYMTPDGNGHSATLTLTITLTITCSLMLALLFITEKNRKNRKKRKLFACGKRLRRP